MKHFKGRVFNRRLAGMTRAKGIGMISDDKKLDAMRDEVEAILDQFIMEIERVEAETEWPMIPPKWWTFARTAQSLARDAQKVIASGQTWDRPQG